MHPSSNPTTTRTVAVRSVVIVVSLIAALLISTAANLTAVARGAEMAPLRAVVVIGPMHEWQSLVNERGRAVADAAEAQGMEVTRLFHPNALWSDVVDAANGANLFIYLGHGNGWPSPYAPFQENTKNGLGLNYPDPDRRSSSDVKYYGANFLRDEIQLAPNAIVMFEQLCYGSGHGEGYMPTPSRSLAVERVDNFANGFIDIGARAVFALEFQPLSNVVNALFEEHATMDSIFRMEFNPYSSEARPFWGWVGWSPSYHDSVLSPGARILVDPHQTESYRRAITGDLEFTSDEWQGAGANDPDGADPVLTGLGSTQHPGTIPGGDQSPTVFTPNGDGISDTVSFHHGLSEPAYLDFDIRDSAGGVVRHFTAWTDGGDGSTTWDGRDADGDFVAEGRYDVTVKPEDRSGKLGASDMTSVKVFKTLKSPLAKPNHIFVRDGDGLAQSTALQVTLTQPAALSWTILDSAGAPVRVLASAQAFGLGLATVSWDGRDVLGALVPDGIYSAVVMATTDAGTYGHMSSVRVMPFKVTAPVWSGPAGTSVKFTIRSAEPLTGWPRIEVRQPGIPMYTGYPLRSGAKDFATTITFRAGPPGDVLIKVIGTDTAGGKQNQTFIFTLTE